MATSLLAIGSTAASSATFTLAAGEAASLILVGSGGSGSYAIIEVQGANNAWVTVDVLTGASGRSTLVVQAVGTFRVTRLAGVACGVDQG